MKKRILFFITSLAGGGAEKVLVNMVNHMSTEKYDITVQTLFDVGVNKQYLNSNINYKYVFRRTVRGISKILLVFNPAKLYKMFVRDYYDVVVSYFQGPTTRIVAGCQDARVKKVQWIHNEFHDRKRITTCYRTDKECILLQKKFDASVYVAESVRDIYLETFPEIKGKDFVLYNVVEADSIRKMSVESIDSIAETFSDGFNIISVGRLVQQKSFDRLINITSKLIKKGYKVNLLILGSGPLKEKLTKQVDELGLGDNVKLLGYKTNPYKYVRWADLFVCSSLHEGFSTAVTEAIVVGTPVITTNCSGMNELLANGEYGVIVENSEDALLNGIENLIKDPIKLCQLKNKAFERGAYFGVDQTIQSIERFFDSM